MLLAAYVPGSSLPVTVGAGEIAAAWNRQAGSKRSQNSAIALRGPSA